MAHEAGRIARWITKKMVDDPMLNTLGFGKGNIHRSRAINGSPTPYIVFSFQPGGIDDNNAGARNLTEPTVLIKIVSRDNEAMDAYDDALDRIDDLFQNAREVTEGLLLCCEGGGLYELPEPADDKSYLNHQGRYWRFYITKLGE